jgi:hypothetical protein
VRRSTVAERLVGAGVVALALFEPLELFELPQPATTRAETGSTAARMSRRLMVAPFVGLSLTPEDAGRRKPT